MEKIIKNISNAPFLIEDLGLYLDIGQEISLNHTIEAERIWQSKDLFENIDSGNLVFMCDDVIVTGGEEAKKYFTPLMSNSKSEVFIRNLELENPTCAQHFLIANLLNLSFQTCNDSLILEDALPNTVVFWSNRLYKTGTIENIEFCSNGASLGHLPAEDNTVDPCNTIDNCQIVPKYNDQASLSITEDTNYVYHGNKSLKIEKISGGTEDRFIFFKPINSDLSDFNHLKVLVYGSGSEEITFYLNSQFLPNSNFYLKAGWQEIKLDISSRLDTKTVTNWGVGLRARKINYPIATYINNISGERAGDLYENGFFTTKGCVLDRDIQCIFIHAHALQPDNTAITYKISLDSGQTWHELLPEEMNCWADVTQWQESFTAYNGLKLKIEMEGTGKESPTLKSLFIMYRFI